MAKKAPKLRERRLPPIPKAIQTPIGPLPVSLVDRKALPDETWGGYFDTRNFAILIANDMALRIQWQVLWHERGHVIADLGGIAMSEEQEETFCWNLATQMLHEMLYG
jgi:hypothetical protein